MASGNGRDRTLSARTGMARLMKNDAHSRRAGGNLTVGNFASRPSLRTWVKVLGISTKSKHIPSSFSGAADQKCEAKSDRSPMEER